MKFTDEYQRDVEAGVRAALEEVVEWLVRANYDHPEERMWQAVGQLWRRHGSRYEIPADRV